MMHNLSYDALYIMFEMQIAGSISSLPGVGPLLLDGLFQKELLETADLDMDIAFIEILEYLLNPVFRANMNCPLGNGMTPLMMAASFGKTMLTDFLLRQPGLDVNARSSTGLTALMIATMNRRVDIVASLLRHPRIDIAAESPDGFSAFWIAVWDKSPDWALVETLEYRVAPPSDANARLRRA